MIDVLETTPALWAARCWLGGSALLWTSLLIKMAVRRARGEYRIGPESPGPEEPVRLTVVIPARDEAANIGTCLDRVLAQDLAGFDVVVLDDGSTDATPRILAQKAADPRLSVLTGGEALPEGWLGKAWACERAARKALEAGAEWLLFIDADVRLHPHAAAAAVGWAQRHELDMVSGLGALEMDGFWEKVIQPAVGGLILAGNDVNKHNDPERTEPEHVMANGQFILLRASRYQEIGGHAAVKSDVLDDVGMARAVVSSGGPYHLLWMSSLFACRMYSSLGEIWDGWTKNLFAGLKHSWGTLGALLLAQLLMVQIPYLVVPLAALGLLPMEWLWLSLAVVTSLQCLRLYGDVTFGNDPKYGTTLILGNIILSVILVGSAVRITRGTARWKGRTV